MKKQVSLFVHFLKRFGVWKGLSLFIQFQTGKVSNIKLPFIQYPFALRPNTSDIPTFYQMFIDNEYSMELPNNPTVIIDGGANIGLFSIKMKNRFPNTKIICIEPDSDNYKMLQQNLSKYENVFFENGGLWNKDATLKVYDKYNVGKWAMVVEENIQDGNVKAISIPTLLKTHHIDYIDILKLDIETSEIQLFSEGYETWLPKVKIIIIELHDWRVEGCSKAFFEAINKCFTSYTYSISGENTIIINTSV